MTEERRRKHNLVQKQSYQRRKARRSAALRIADLARQGITATTEDSTPTTWHVGTASVELRAPTINDPRGEYTPWKPEGALWSSPGTVAPDGSVTTAWTDWCDGQDTRYTFASSSAPAQSEPVLTRVEAAAGAVVIKIDGQRDMDALVARYPHEDDPDRVSFTAMADDGIDAVHLTEQGRVRLAVGWRDPLYGWDAESVAWMHTARLRIVTTDECLGRPSGV